jgi:hypothetical protein
VTPTSRRGLPRPVLTDNPDVPRDIGALADALDPVMAALITGTTAARTAYTPKDGDIWWTTDDFTIGPYGTPYKWDNTNALWRIFGPVSPAPQVALNNVQLLGPGVTSQQRAGRILTLADFTTLLGMSTPVGLFNLGDLTNLGSGGGLTNKGGVPFGVGVTGSASSAAVFAGSVSQALYIADTGGADPFRIRYGTFGAWIKTSKRSQNQYIMAKQTSSIISWSLMVASGNTAQVSVSLDGNPPNFTLTGVQDIADNRWHQIVASYDGAVLRLYVDGAIDVELPVPFPSQPVPIFGSSGPLNIGSAQADGSTNASLPSFGRVDEAFVTNDVLNEDQIRLLYAAKFAHNYGTTPTRFRQMVTRRRRGVALATSDFPSTPARLYNFTAGSLADIGSNNTPVTANVGTGVIGANPGPDGIKDGARMYYGAHTGDSSTDTGLPTGVRSYGCWFKVPFSNTITSTLMAWGAQTATSGVAVNAISGVIVSYNGDWTAVPDVISGVYVADNQWHHVVVVEDPSASDGVLRKVYVDGRLNAQSLVYNALTLGGAGRFRIGAKADGTTPAVGSIDGVFVIPAALTAEQITSLYAKGGLPMPSSPTDPAPMIEAADATNVYYIGDNIELQNLVHLEVAA